MFFNKRFIYLLLCIVPLVSFTAHKFYLSLVQIEHVKEKQSVQIIISVFMDDIELALNENNNIDLRLSTKKEPENSEDYMKEYLQKNFYLKIDGALKNFNFLGKEYKGDEVFFYLEIENIENIHQLEIVNTILVQHFPKQQNLIKLKVNGKNKSKLLNRENDKVLLKF